MPPQAELKGHVDKRTFLSAHPFFKGLKPELIDQIGSHAIIRVVKAGAVIYGKGDPGDSLVKVALPVTFTPGRLRLATRPDATGSPPPVNTIGMVVVAPCQVGNINRLLPVNMLLNEVIDLAVQAALQRTLVLWHDLSFTHLVSFLSRLPATDLSTPDGTTRIRFEFKYRINAARLPL